MVELSVPSKQSLMRKRKVSDSLNKSCVKTTQAVPDVANALWLTTLTPQDSSVHLTCHNSFMGILAKNHVLQALNKQRDLRIKSCTFVNCRCVGGICCK